MFTKLNSVYVSRLFGALGFQIFSIYATLKTFELSPHLSTMGWLGFTTFLSVALFSFGSGALVDRLKYQGRYAVAIHAATAALGLCSIAMMSHVESISLGQPLAFLFFLVFAFGSLRVMRSPIYFVLTQRLMVNGADAPGASNLSVAKARFFVVSWQFAGVIGPLLGAFVALSFGLKAMQGLYSLFFFLGFAFLLPVWSLRLALIPQAQTIDTEKDLRGRSCIRALIRQSGLGESLQYFMNNRVIRETFLIDTVGVLFAGASAFLPFLLSEAHLSPNYLGIIRAVQNAGAMTVALVIGQNLIRRRTGQLFVTSVLGFAALTLAIPFLKTLIAFIVVFALLGWLDGVSILIRDMLLFKTATSHLRGRIYALNSIFISSSDDLGEMESGFAGHLIGIPAALIAGGLACAAITLYYSTKSKDLWNYQLGRDEVGSTLT